MQVLWNGRAQMAESVQSCPINSTSNRHGINQTAHEKLKSASYVKNSWNQDCTTQMNYNVNKNVEKVLKESKHMKKNKKIFITNHSV